MTTFIISRFSSLCGNAATSYTAQRAVSRRGFRCCRVWLTLPPWLSKSSPWYSFTTHVNIHRDDLDLTQVFIRGSTVRAIIRNSLNAFSRNEIANQVLVSGFKRPRGIYTPSEEFIACANKLYGRKRKWVSECWRFNAVPTARVIFRAKTSFDVFSLSQEQVWTFSVFGWSNLWDEVPICSSRTQCPLYSAASLG